MALVRHDDAMADIDAIRDRALAATSGSWRRHGADVWVEGSPVPLFVGRDAEATARQQADLDAEFVARARDDVLALLATLDAFTDDAGSIGRHGRET